MSKRDQKKEAILLAGMEIMLGKGYNGTSVKDIVDAAGVPKGSFYNYFASKEDFALTAVEHAANENLAEAQKVLGDKSINSLVRLASYFEASIQKACSAQFKAGCFLGNMCQEMADSSCGLREVLDRKMQRLTGEIASVIEEVFEERGNQRGLQATQTAEFLFNAWEGALMRAKASKSRAPLDAFLTMLPVIL